MKKAPGSSRLAPLPRGLFQTVCEVSVIEPFEKVNAKRRAIPELESEVLDPFAGCHVLILSPAGKALRPEFSPGKRYSLAEDGSVAALPYGRAAWLQARRATFATIYQLHQFLERERAQGSGFMSLGDVADGADWRSLRRTLDFHQATLGAAPKGKGLSDEESHLLVLDMDDVPALGMDPRKDPRAAAEDLRSLLPDALASALASYQFSASTCVRGPDNMPLAADITPETVGAHFRFLLDEPLRQAERVALIRCIALHVAAARPGAKVDPAAGVANQPLYLKTFFGGGAIDPLPGGLRSGLLSGEPRVRLENLIAELPAPCDKKMPLRRRTPQQQKAATAEARRTASEAWKARREHDRLLAGARRQRPPAPGMTVPPFGVRPDPCKTAPKRGKARKQQIFRERALLDMLDIAHRRRAEDPAWANGVPDGMRRNWMASAAALLCWLVHPSELELEVELFGRRTVGKRWLEERWIGQGMCKTAVATARQAMATGNVALRPYRNRAFLLTALTPTYEEQLGLRSIRSEAVRSFVRRQNDGSALREDWLENNTTARDKPWLAAGVSRATWYRRIAAEKAASAPAAPSEPMVTAEELALAADIIVVAVGAPNVRQVERVLAGTGPTRALSDRIISRIRASEAVNEAWLKASGDRRDKLRALISPLSVLEGLNDVDEPGEVARYVLSHEAFRHARAALRTGQPVMTLAAALDAFVGTKDVLDEAAVLRALADGSPVPSFSVPLRAVAGGGRPTFW